MQLLQFMRQFEAEPNVFPSHPITFKQQNDCRFEERRGVLIVGDESCNNTLPTSPQLSTHEYDREYDPLLWWGRWACIPLSALV